MPDRDHKPARTGSGGPACVASPRPDATSMAALFALLVLAVAATPLRAGVGARPRPPRHGRLPERDRLAGGDARCCWPRAATPSTPPWRRRSRWRSRIRRPGNLGGGGFLLLRPAERRGRPSSTSARRPRRRRHDVPADGMYDEERHHDSHLAVRRARHGGGPALAPASSTASCRGRTCVRAGGRAGARTASCVDDAPGAVAPRRAASDAEALRRLRAVLGKPDGEALRDGRRAQAAGPGADAPAHRRAGPGRLLRGRDGRAARRGDEGRRRPHHPDGPRGVPRRRCACRCTAPTAATRSCACRRRQLGRHRP